MAEEKKDIHNKGNVGNQINQSTIHGDVNINSNPSPKVPRWLTPIPSFEETLIGRDKDLEQLAQMIEESRNVALINGMGGIGKTTLAIAYVDQYKEQYDHIAWIDQLQDFASSMAANPLFLEKIGATKLSNNPDQNARLILSKLGEIQGKCLLVIDNAEQDLTAYKPHLPRGWDVLITSREELGFQATYTLDFLDEASAVALFKSHCKYSQEEELIKEIVKTVDYHTLSIELLAKTAAKKRATLPLDVLWKRIKEQGLKLGKKVGLSTTHSRQDKIDKIFPYLIAVFQVDKLSDQENWLLKQFACLPPTFHSFKDLAGWIKKETEEEKEELEDSLTKLRSKGWLVFEEESYSFKMHRIIQEVIIAQLPITLVHIDTLINTFIDLLRFNKLVNPVHQFPFIPFAEQILSNVKDQQKENVADLMQNLGEAHMHQGKYQQAEDYLLKTLQIKQEVFKTNDYSLGNSYNSLAFLYKLQGKYELALEHHLKSVKIYELALKPNDPNLAVVYDNLGQVYQLLENYDQAMEHFQKAIRIKEEVLASHDPRLGVSYNNIAMVYYNQGKKELASDFLEKAVKIYQESLDANHPELATSYSNIGQIYQNQKKYKKAIVYTQKAIKIEEQSLGFEHPELGLSYHNISVIYHHMKKYPLAKSYNEKALHIWQNALGDQHPWTQIGKKSLENLLDKLP